MSASPLRGLLPVGFVLVMLLVGAWLATSAWWSGVQSELQEQATQLNPPKAPQGSSARARPGEAVGGNRDETRAEENTHDARELGQRRRFGSLMAESRQAEADGRLASAIRLARAAWKLEGTGDRARRNAGVRLANLISMRAEEAESFDRRRELAEEALEAHPEHPRALFVLASACEEENDLECAQDAYRRLQDAQPDARGIDSRLERLDRQQEVEADFDHVRTTHFVARFEGLVAEELAWAALEVLEQAYFSVGEALGRYPAEPITVVVYSGGQFGQATLAPDWSGGIFDGKIRLKGGDLASNERRLVDVLHHEYVHALLARTVDHRLPTWFHEGLAQNLEPGFDAVRSLDRFAEADRVLDLSELAGPFLKIESPALARLAYAQSATMVANLIEQEGLDGLTRLLARAEEGRPMAAAFEELFRGR